MFNESGIRAAMPVAALAIFISSVAAHGRTWTDTKGRSIDAELSRIEGSTAIVTKGGKEVRMPLQILSEQDKKFVAEWSAKQKQAPAAVATTPNVSVKPAPSAKPAPAAAPAQPASTEPYYADGKTPIFLPFPNVTDKKPWNIKYFGPVGIGIRLIRPGMTIQIINVE